MFDEINHSLQRFWEVDSLETELKANVVMTNEEKEALNKVSGSLKKDGQRYKGAVPWVNDRPKLTNNYEMDVSRLKNTKKRLLHQRATGVYKTIICFYQEKGYIRKVENHPREKEHIGGVWYLPHFPACRPDKSTTKTRIVFDASAKFNRTSLNDEIHPGPKLQTSLFDVFIRF